MITTLATSQNRRRKMRKREELRSENAFSVYSLVSQIGSLFHTRSLDFHAKVGILASLAFELEVAMG
jgi:hypothetical protein